MSIAAKVIADSISPAGKRLTTFEITAHRWILAEINTHRMLSRNYRSSRAVPVAKLLEEVRTNPAMPVRWLKNQKGMQAAERLTGWAFADAEREWRDSAALAADGAERLAGTGLHKQWANRVLEPYLYVHGVISATEWQNFFGLRCHKDAQPEFQELAEAMYEVMAASTPALLQPGEWHLPYVSGADTGAFGMIQQYLRGGPGGMAAWCDEQFVEVARKVSAARCCRVSYKPFDADRPSTVEEDLALCAKLAASQPIHASPFEHQATPDVWIGWSSDGEDYGDWDHPELHGNFVGWCQHRKMFPGEEAAPFARPL